jgi:hypothetical protein
MGYLITVVPVLGMLTLTEVDEPAASIGGAGLVEGLVEGSVGSAVVDIPCFDPHIGSSVDVSGELPEPIIHEPVGPSQDDLLELD